MKNKSVNNYLEQAKNNTYSQLTPKLFREIEEEGFLDDLNFIYENDYKIEDFEFTELNLTGQDKRGLEKFEEETVEKFNLFDIKLKEKQKGYPTIVDFIYYEKGKVIIIKLKTSKFSTGGILDWMNERVFTKKYNSGGGIEEDTYSIYYYENEIPKDENGKPDVSKMKLIHKFLTDEQVHNFLREQAEIGNPDDASDFSLRYYVVNDLGQNRNFFYGLSEIGEGTEDDEIVGSYQESAKRFKNPEEYYEFINEAFKSGNLNVTKERFKKLSDTQKEKFFEYINTKDYGELFRFLWYAGKYKRGGIIQWLNEKIF